MVHEEGDIMKDRLILWLGITMMILAFTTSLYGQHVEPYYPSGEPKDRAWKDVFDK